VLLDGKIPTVSNGYATVKAKGQIVIPVDLRRRFQIEEGTSVVFLEQEGKLILQPVTDEFINGMQGILSGQGLPPRVERTAERKLR
jgi:AbrB family looped-hinge helix DNA binding protein